MPFRAPPSTASWQHREARSGFEVAYFQESSAMTNTLPVHRLDLPTGAQAAAPAAYVRALDLTVERLEQTYLRIADQGAHRRYNYSAPAFGFTSCLVYDENGLVIDYPGIALRTR
jgi:hypothetical protein